MVSSRNNDGTFKKGSHWRPPRSHWDKAWLRREYEENGRSAAEIAAEAGCTEGNIYHWMKKHCIPRRSMSEVRAVKHWGPEGEDNPMFGKCGEASSAWKGGISPERQSLYARAMWKAIRREVMERDGFACQRCKSRPVEHRSLHTHHIKPWAKNITTRFHLENIITVCRPCHQWIHSRENKSREFMG